MLSAFIPSARSYPAMALAGQLVHQRCVHPGPLVLRTTPLKFPTPTTDRDRTVSRRSEPSSRTTLIGSSHPGAWRRSQGFGCPPIKVVRELGSERRETVRSLSVVGVGYLRGADLSTKGPGWTHLRCTSCSAKGIAG